MKTYACDKCEMEIKCPICAKCDTPLEEKVVDKHGTKIKVAECPKCHGKIKSPQCCDGDMKCH